MKRIITVADIHLSFLIKIIRDQEIIIFPIGYSFYFKLIKESILSPSINIDHAQSEYVSDYIRFFSTNRYGV